MTFQIAPLSDALPFGVIVSGIGWPHLQSRGAVEDLRELWIQHGLILFREIEDSPEFQIELSKCFGPLEPHPVQELWVKDYPELISIVSRPDAGTIMSVEGRDVANWIPWHSDLVYVSRINRGGLLRVVQRTSWGGETCFIDQIEAYERLPDRLRKCIEGVEVVYQMKMLDNARYSKRLGVELVRASATLKSLKERIGTDFPPVTHPAVYTQKETGRRVLNISPLYAERVLGMGEQEGCELLDELVDHIVRCPTYKHSWQDGEMILWDNWRMVHAVTGAPSEEVRIMRRTTIGGDYGLGRQLSHAEIE